MIGRIRPSPGLTHHEWLRREAVIRRLPQKQRELIRGLSRGVYPVVGRMTWAELEAGSDPATPCLTAAAMRLRAVPVRSGSIGAMRAAR
jgi:hypothetical protein